MVMTNTDSELSEKQERYIDAFFSRCSVRDPYDDMFDEPVTALQMKIKPNPIVKTILTKVTYIKDSGYAFAMFHRTCEDVFARSPDKALPESIKQKPGLSLFQKAELQLFNAVARQVHQDKDLWSPKKGP